MKFFPRYIYTDDAVFHSIEEACSTLYAGHKYMLAVLIQKCHDYIRSNLAPSNVIQVFEFLELMGETDLYQPCFLIISKYIKLLLLQPKTHMKSSTLAIVLKLDDLNINEPQLFAGAVRWAHVECYNRSLSVIGQNLRTVLVEAEALSNIRFLTFSPEAFLSGPSNSNILKSHEINAIWNAIYKRSESKENFNNIENQNEISTKSELPDGLSHVSEFRHKISLNKRYCVRSFLKASQAVLSSSLNLMTSVTVNKPVFMQGIRFFTRLVPNPGLGRLQTLSATYKENMQISIFNQKKKKLFQMIFTDDSEYITKATVLFKKSFILVPGEEYSIFIESLCTDNFFRGEYPVAYLSHAEASHGIVFTFCDHCQFSSNGSFVQRLDMGFIDSIVFAPA